MNDFFPSNQIMRFLPCRVWRTYLGGKMIDEFQGNDNPEDGHLPEDWIGSVVRANNPGREDIVEGYSALASPIDPTKIITLKALFDTDASSYLGESHAQHFKKDTGVLIKLLDAAMRLPIQAHPSKDESKRIFNSDYGKTESWIVLGTREINGEKPYILLGFKDGVTKKKWRDLYDRQDIGGMIECLHRIEVHDGDVFFVRHGIPHGIGPGCFLCEIQEPSDLVFRTELISPTGAILNEKIVTMGLGVDKMMDSFSYEGCSLEETLARYRLAPVILFASDDFTLTELIGENVTDCFGAQLLQGKGSIEYKPDGFSIAIVADGYGSVDCDGNNTDFRRGDAMFIPFGVKKLNWSSEKSFKIIFALPPRC